MTSEPRSDATSELDAMLEESRKQFDALYDGGGDTRAPEKPTPAATPAPEPAAPATPPVFKDDETATIQGSAAGVAFSVASKPGNAEPKAAAFRATKKDAPG